MNKNRAIAYIKTQYKSLDWVRLIYAGWRPLTQPKKLGADCVMFISGGVTPC